MLARCPPALLRRPVRLTRAGLALAVYLACLGTASAQSVLTFRYTPAPRAQLAIWIEDGSGQFLSTVALTEAVGYRGIGNRPGSSDMNSGYRWPYGRREGVLPIWAHRRASAKGARLFPRVIFQDRVEGLASRTASDQSPDDYYCLQFDRAKSSQDQLDAVSCATPFTSDKGRYLTAADVAAGYAEPYEASPGEGVLQPLPHESYYPPRMDVARCSETGCFDHPDVERFADDARAVMPEIDTVTIATPTGLMPQSLLFTVPQSWPAGQYAAYIEVNVEGDYNDAWNAQRFPTPRQPMDKRDSFSYDYGYAYRGQPSLVWKVDFTLGQDPDAEAFATEPAGRASWDHWSEDYGEIEPVSVVAGDPERITADEHSGADRLLADASGRRFVMSLGQYAAKDGGTSAESGAASTDPGAAASAAQTGGAGRAADSEASRNEVLSPGDAGTKDVNEPVEAASGEPEVAQGRDDSTSTDPSSIKPGPVRDLALSRHDNVLRSHAWVRLRLRAAESELPLHAYEVRVSTEPIEDERTFIRNGRQAKTATDAKEGPSYLELPTDVPAGEWIEATIGDLAAQTHYYVGVRARGINNQPGPLSVADITTSDRTFATVTPCFLASVAFGSPLAAEVGSLRRFRDRHLLVHALGRSWVAAYYRVGAPLAEWIAPHPGLRRALRALLTPLLSVVD